MAKTLIRSARIIDKNSPFHQQQLDILIDKGRIVKIGKKIKADKSTKIIAYKNLFISLGWMDLRVDFAEPGHEYKEGIQSGLQAAAYGGFTTVVVMPSTFPAIDNRSSVEFLVNRANGHVVKLLPTGTVSKDGAGVELSEMYDMKQGGAIAFSDDKLSIKNNSLLFKALTYSQAFDGLVMDFPMDLDWVREGQMNEGKTSTEMGMKGIPVEAESIIVARDLTMLEYTGGKLHLGPISTALSVDLIRKAKRKGLKVSSEVTAHNIYFTDKELGEFDSNFKLMPPLRDEKNRKALLKGLKDGTIDALVSDHKPQDIDEKRLEFGSSSFGAIGLETLFPVGLAAIDDLELCIASITSGPRRVMDMDIPVIEEGAIADLTLFDPDKKWEVNSDTLHSRSLNSPYLGETMRGKALGIIRDGKVFLSER